MRRWLHALWMSALLAMPAFAQWQETPSLAERVAASCEPSGSVWEPFLDVG